MSELRATVLRLLAEAYPNAAICIFVHQEISGPDENGMVQFEHNVWTNCDNNELAFAMNEAAMAGYLADGPDETFDVSRRKMT